MSPTLYFCAICQKPFEKELSRNRHISYCKRTQNRSKLRLSPCQQCGHAKLKCDRQIPCARCTRKGIACIYEKNHVHSNRGTSSSSTSPSVTEGLENQDLDRSHTAIPEESSDSSSSCNSLVRRGSSSSNDGGLWSAWTTKDDWYPGLACQNATNIRVPSGILIPYPVSGSAKRISASHILSLIRSIPQMMLRQATFPPFIHKNEILLEPLRNCMNICKVFASRNKPDTAFLWRICFMEQARLANIAENLSKFELIASIQAYMVYISMMALDREFVSDEQVFYCLRSYQILFERFRKAAQGPFCEDELSRPSSNWREWIFAESRRRVTCLWFLLTKVLNMRCGIPCDVASGYRVVPLPCSNALWSTGNQAEWEMEYGEYLRSKTSLRFMGQLQDLHAEDSGINSQELETWNAEIDNLGLMLNIVIPLI